MSMFLWKSKKIFLKHTKKLKTDAHYYLDIKLYDKQETGKKKYLWMFTQHPSKIYKEKSSEIYKEIDRL